MELAELSEKLQETADAHLYRACVENYYQNVYDYHKTIGLPNPPASLDAKRIESVLQTEWSGKNYSARIWANRTKLTTICAAFDTPISKTKKFGERFARETNRERAPADITYREWKAVYIDKELKTGNNNRFAI